MPKPPNRKRWTRVRRCVWVAFSLAMAVLFARNWLAKVVVERMSSSLLGTATTVDRISVGFRTIRIDGLRIRDSGCSNENQVTVEKIVLHPSIWNGLQSGVWVPSAHVIGAALEVRFDREGKLVTKFPVIESGRQGTSVIPLQSLIVDAASIVVRQDGKKPLEVFAENVHLEFGDRITCVAQLPDLLGGVVNITSAVDVETLEGETRLEVAGLVLDTKQLAEFPLAPPSIGDRRLVCKSSIQATIEHPPNELDLRRHGLEIHSRFYAIQPDALADVCESCRFTINSSNGKLKLRGEAEPAAGHAEFLLKSDVIQWPLVVECWGQAEQISIHRIAATIEQIMNQRLPSLEAIGDANFRSRVVCGTESAQFSVQIESHATGLSVDEMAGNDMQTRIEIDGIYNLNAEMPLTGTVNGTYDWGGVSVANLAQRFQLGPASGEISSKGNFRLPLHQLHEPSSYVLFGELRSRNVAVGGLSLEDADFTFGLDGGEATATLQETRLLDELSNPVGSMRASVRARLEKNGQIEADYAAWDLAAKAVARLRGFAPAAFDGTFASQGSVSVTIQDVLDPLAWRANAKATGKNVRFENEEISDFTLSCVLEHGQLDVPLTEIDWRQTKVRVRGNGSIHGTPEFRGSFLISPILLGDLSKLASQFSDTELPMQGTAELDGQFVLHAIPFDFKASGQAKLSEASFGTTDIGEAVLDWSANPTSFVFVSSSEDFLGGAYEMTASLEELDWTKTRIAGQFSEIPLARLIPFTGMNVPVTGVLEGGMLLDSIGRMDSLTGRCWLRSRGATIRRIPFELFEASVRLGKGQATVNASGQLSDGRFEANSQGSLSQVAIFLADENRRLVDLPVTGEARLSKLSIHRVLADTDLRTTLPLLSGSIDGQLIRDESAIDDGLLCRVTGATENISWNRSRLSDRITADVEVRPDRITLRQLRGRIADGQLSGRAEVKLQDRLDGSYQFATSNVSLRRASMPFVRDTDVFGKASINVAGRLGNIITGQLKIQADNASVSGISLRQARIPIECSYSQSSKQLRWRCRNGVLEAGAGNIYLVSEGSYSNGLNSSTTARLERIDSSRLLRGNSMGAGIVDGTVSIQSTLATSLQEFSGRFDIDLTHTKAMEMPVLNQLPKLIKLPRIGSEAQQDDGGYVQGRLANGMIYLDEMAITQSNIHLLMNGTSTLDGRLAFDVTASTDQSGPVDDLIALADSPLMLAGPAPLALLAKANDALKNRVIHVHVSGTAARPTLQLQPGKQLAQDAVKFFITRGMDPRIAKLSPDRNVRLR